MILNAKVNENKETIRSPLSAGWDWTKQRTTGAWGELLHTRLPPEETTTKREKSTLWFILRPFIFLEVHYHDFSKYHCCKMSSQQEAALSCRVGDQVLELLKKKPHLVHCLLLLHFSQVKVIPMVKMVPKVSEKASHLLVDKLLCCLFSIKEPGWDITEGYKTSSIICIYIYLYSMLCCNI